MTQLNTDLYFLLPEIFIGSITIFLLIWSTFQITMHKINAESILKNLITLVITTTILGFILMLNNLNITKTICYENLVINNYTTNIKLLIILFTIFFLSLIKYSEKQNFPTDFESIILKMLSLSAMLILTSANDFVILYLSLELQSLCFYILTASKKTSRFSLEGGLKYFIVGALSSSFLLFGISLIYGLTGSTNFSNLYQLTIIIQNTPILLKLGFILLLCSFLLKLTAVPFHIWSPDVYEGAPLSITIFFSTIPKIAIFSIFIRLIFSVFLQFHNLWHPIFVLSSILTIIFASFATLYQKKLKRFLAYSSISHIGYMLMGLSTGTMLGLHSFFLYLLIYVTTIFCFFGLLILIKKNTNKNLIYLTDLLNPNTIHPLYKFTFILLLFSIAGIPPLWGFFIKFQIFLSLIDLHSYILVALGILTSTTSTYYYIRLIKIINFEKFINLNYKKYTLDSTIAILIIFSGSLLISLFLTTTNILLLPTHELSILL
uniref:4ce7c71e-3935-46ca-807d-4b838787743f-CDS n=1 Tax=Plasmodiophora brassicae TaxID=37360 RepID=A0A3P3YWB5_PLABS|nr:4ce7c71e-3935-46ca-807d-4b838787743f-CDS [Plasmodiophora brassicae]